MNNSNTQEQQEVGCGACSALGSLRVVWMIEDEMGLRCNIRFHELLATKAKKHRTSTLQLTAEQRMDVIEELENAERPRTAAVNP